MQINIKLQPISYTISIEKNREIRLLQRQKNKTGKMLIVTDKNVYKLYKKQLDQFENILVLPAGESTKQLKFVEQIIDRLFALQFGRKDILVAFGGGVIGDLTGFVASIFKRGIPFVQVPTTLLSMLDSSVGGKTGIDYQGAKNIIGTFNSPLEVIICPSLLNTLPQDQILSGWLEGYKHAIITPGKNTENWLKILETLMTGKNISVKNFGEALEKNVSVKAKIVMKDYYETKGLRIWLNYGHTFGHAIESVMNYSLPHGICVGYGMLYENILAEKLGILDKKVCDEINKNLILIFNTYQIHFKKNLNFKDLLPYLYQDKKNIGKEIKRSLLEKYGKIQFTSCSDEKLLEECYKEFCLKV